LVIPALLAALSIPFSSPFELQIPRMMVLFASPHFEPTGWVVAAIGREIVTQLLKSAQTAIAAIVFLTNFISLMFLIEINVK
jgi:hypothetical protein